jgi:hypothetical protein
MLVQIYTPIMHVHEHSNWCYLIPRFAGSSTGPYCCIPWELEATLLLVQAKGFNTLHLILTTHAKEAIEAKFNLIEMEVLVQLQAREPAGTLHSALMKRGGFHPGFHLA